VRQLANAIEHACVLCTDPLIGPEYIPWEDSVAPTAPDREFPPGIMPLDLAERMLIERALRASGGCQARAAKLLGLDRRRLYRKVQHYWLHDLTRGRGGLHGMAK